MNNLWLVIPTATRHKYLEQLFNESNIPADKRILVRTTDGVEIADCVNLFYRGEFNIHKWWNLGIGYAQSKGAEYVAVLNDDVILADNPLHKIATSMKASGAVLGYPFPFQGWVSGYCWVLDVKSGIRPDEEYVWWYGDRDLDLQARQLGEHKVIHVPVKVRHVEGNVLTSQSQELMDLTKKDEERFFKKWNLEKAN